MPTLGTRAWGLDAVTRLAGWLRRDAWGQRRLLPLRLQVAANGPVENGDWQVADGFTLAKWV